MSCTVPSVHCCHSPPLFSLIEMHFDVNVNSQPFNQFGLRVLLSLLCVHAGIPCGTLTKMMTLRLKVAWPT
jgi:hypothetical protein